LIILHKFYSNLDILINTLFGLYRNDPEVTSFLNKRSDVIFQSVKVAETLGYNTKSSAKPVEKNPGKLLAATMPKSKILVIGDSQVRALPNIKGALCIRRSGATSTAIRKHAQKALAQEKPDRVVIMAGTVDALQGGTEPTGQNIQLIRDLFPMAKFQIIGVPKRLRGREREAEAVNKQLKRYKEYHDPPSVLCDDGIHFSNEATAKWYDKLAEHQQSHN
jgi:hypothetical protein